MRDLGADAAEYAALQQGKLATTVWRVYSAGHGIVGEDDPFDLSDYVLSASVERTGRGELNSGTLVLDNSDGAFDKETGALYDLIAPNNAEIQVDMGTRLAAGPTYWRMLTGGVLKASMPYDVMGSQVTVSLGDRGRNLADITVTSELFETEQSNDLLTALFTNFAGFAPGDFNLPALVHEIRIAQWETEPLITAANEILQPSGKCIRFDYDGRLSHHDLTPAGWASVLTVPKIAVADLSPQVMGPSATRIMVAGGPDYSRPMIGAPEKFGISTYAYHFKAGNKILGVGDVFSFYPDAGYHMNYWFAGPKGRPFRLYASYLDNYLFTKPLPDGTIEANMVRCFDGGDGHPVGTRPHVHEEHYALDEGESLSALNPEDDMTLHPADVDMTIAVDGGAATPVVFDWTGCNTRALVAAEMQTKIQALGGAFAEVTVTVLFAPVAGNFRYLVTSGNPGGDSAVVITAGVPNDCAVWLKLGVANGGIETRGGEDRHEIHMYLDCGDWNPEIYGDGAWIHMNFEVWAYPIAWGAPPCDVQVWDAALIEKYGEIRKPLQAPLALTYVEAEQAGRDELLFAKGKMYPIRATLHDLDVRVEPHDPITVEKKLGGDVTCWVQRVMHTVGPSPQTVIEAIGIPT